MVDRLCVSLSLTLCVRVDRGLAPSLSPFSLSLVFCCPFFPLFLLLLQSFFPLPSFLLTSLFFSLFLCFFITLRPFPLYPLFAIFASIHSLPYFITRSALDTPTSIFFTCIHLPRTLPISSSLPISSFTLYPSSLLPPPCSFPRKAESINHYSPFTHKCHQYKQAISRSVCVCHDIQRLTAPRQQP